MTPRRQPTPGQRRAAMLLATFGEGDRETVLLAVTAPQRALLRREAVLLLDAAGGDRELLALVLRQSVVPSPAGEPVATANMPPRLAAAVRAAWQAGAPQSFAALLQAQPEGHDDV